MMCVVLILVAWLQDYCPACRIANNLIDLSS